jgi:hypothetical protein
MAYLLKWRIQPEARRSGRIGSIAEQRLQIAGQLEDSPSLKGFLPEAAASAYHKAPALAARETGFGPESFPVVCPFALSKLLDDDLYPAL